MSLRLSVVLPCYNEAANLPALLERYRGAQPAGLDWELVLVQNGSTDSSDQVMDALLARPEHAFARKVTVEVNQGYGYGMAQGLAAARGEALCISHADMQCDAKDAFDAYALWAAQTDRERVLVKGRRQRRALSQQVVTWGMSAVATLALGRRLSDINAQPKLFSRALLDHLAAMPTGFEFDVYVLYSALASGGRLQTLDVHFGERLHGESKWAAHTFLRWRTIARVFWYILTLRYRVNA